MKFIFPFLGKTREKYLDQGIRDYAGRLSRFVTVDMVFIRERHDKNGPDKTVRRKEAELLLAQCPAKGLVVALDPGGTQPDSEKLARLVRTWQDGGVRNVCFLIGGHLGLDSSVLARADVVISLSRLTFTHEMTRLILMEQLYRACTINGGQKYHK
ncbi:ribosomal RNA large subunit methyltransferase H [Desulfolithobacter dissulfuricans]|uniref:Ribosomal RNA large subunit methyltransferase H n=1 Tax=Desulfolithobacter dissulfuricans TaxID=2795293 RepID=A0A915U061_9BACT|nr:23S rRNA (pseudouridine(1915)-N(3))-methyltransferase RlmH [Desulfolithobacter dissulfuricans]BCO09031.1 ribosomal RNA large subunit methyltransferase H [Desulfolithobacter dissulfuricans]